MATKRVFVATQISNELKSDFLEAIENEYNGASDFFRRRINAKCAVVKTSPSERDHGKGFISLSVSVTPEQRAALLAQCKKEGKTMGTWMRDEIKKYLENKKSE